MADTNGVLGRKLNVHSWKWIRGNRFVSLNSLDLNSQMGKPHAKSFWGQLQGSESVGVDGVCEWEFEEKGRLGKWVLKEIYEGVISGGLGWLSSRVFPFSFSMKIRARNRSFGSWENQSTWFCSSPFLVHGAFFASRRKSGKRACKPSEQLKM